jgi:hypothetical protein
MGPLRACSAMSWILVGGGWGGGRWVGSCWSLWWGVVRSESVGPVLGKGGVEWGRGTLARLGVRVGGRGP